MACPKVLGAAMSSNLEGKLATVKGDSGIWQIRRIQADPITGRIEAALILVSPAYTPGFKIAPVADLVLVSKSEQPVDVAG